MDLLGFPILSGVAALILVLGLVWLAARAARLTGLAPRSGSSRRLSVVETLSLDQRRRVSIVRCDGRELLLLTGGGSDAALGWIAPKDDTQ